MSDEYKNNITYDDDWKSVSTAEYAKVYTEHSQDDENDNDIENNGRKIKKQDKKKSSYPKQYLITIQLIICIILALAAFLLKGFGGEVYAAAREWYYSNLNSSIIFDIGSKEINLDNLFSGATADEV